MDGSKAGVTIAAAYSKNRRHENLPLRPTTAAAMADHLSGKLPAAKAFSMPARGHLVDMFRADLVEAREAWFGKAKDAEARQERESSNFLVYRDDANRVADFMPFDTRLSAISSPLVCIPRPRRLWPVIRPSH